MQEAALGSFGAYLRNRLMRANMSMRKLAEQCGIDVSTISRLAAGTQKPRPEHIEKISTALTVPVLDLWRAAGYIAEEDQSAPPTGLVNEFLVAAFPELANLRLEQIEAELEKYRLFAQTFEGHHAIVQNFRSKLEQVNGTGPFIDMLKDMYMMYLDGKTDEEQRHLIASALLYFILATDVIPDYLFPIGYIDDAIAIDLVWKKLQAQRREN